jgi:hypothetical protein
MCAASAVPQPAVGADPFRQASPACAGRSTAALGGAQSWGVRLGNETWPILH